MGRDGATADREPVPPNPAARPGPSRIWDAAAARDTRVAVYDALHFVKDRRTPTGEQGTDPMATRGPELQAFLDGVRAGFEASRPDRETERCARRIFALLDGAAGPAREGGHRSPVCSDLPRALRTAGSAAPAPAGVAAAFEVLEPSLTWGRRSGGPSASANFADGHANALVVGPGGIEDRDDVWVGVSLLAPHVRYPDHRHAPEEIYLALSPGEFRRAAGRWFEPGVGGTFYNEPGIVHAMRSGPAPLFAVWCLRPVGAA